MNQVRQFRAFAFGFGVCLALLGGAVVALGQSDEIVSQLAPLNVSLNQRTPITLTLTMSEDISANEAFSVPVELDLNLQLALSSLNPSVDIQAEVAEVAPTVEVIEPLPTPTQSPAGLGRRSNPVPAGDAFMSENGFEVRVLDVNYDATEELMENMFNSPPEEDMRFVMVEIEAANVGGSVDEAAEISAFAFNLVSSSGAVYDETCGLYDGALEGELYQGGTTVGTVCRIVPDNETGFLLRYEPFFSGVSIFFSLPEAE